MPFEAFPSQAAVTRLRAPCPPVVALEARSTTVLRQPQPLPRLPDLRALLHLRSRSERSTVTSRVLPVASLGFSFQCVSCPTRHSSELRAHSSRQAERWGTSRSPKANPGPAATVADGADRLCRAEPASRTPRKASLAETADMCLRTCHPLCSCWRRCVGRTPCALSVQHPKMPAAPSLTAGFSVHTTQAIHTKGTSSRSPERSVCSKASLASHRATARLTSRSDLSSSLVDVQHRCRRSTNPDYRAVGDRRWWTPPAPTGNRRPCQRLTRFHNCGPSHSRASSVAMVQPGTRLTLAGVRSPSPTTKKRTVASCCGRAGPPLLHVYGRLAVSDRAKCFERACGLLRAIRPQPPASLHDTDAQFRRICEQARNGVLGAQGRAPSAVSSRRVNRQHRARVLDCIQNEEYWLSSKSAEA
jgi:hypothetical protein